MAKKTFIMWAIAALVAAVALLLFFLRKPRKTEPEVSTGTLEWYKDFQSEFIRARDVVVWLPDGYTKGDTCDVLYMHDGQMLFDADVTWNHQEWKVDEVAGALIAEGRTRPFIVVGIYNTADRLIEYFPDKAAPEGSLTEAPHGDAYLQFLVKELKPIIDKNYHPGRSFIAGSSCGGLISLYAFCEYPDVFSGAACLSTHSSMDHLPFVKDSELMADAFLTYLRANLPAPNSRLLYMDYGLAGMDKDYGPSQEKIDALMAELGWDAEHYVTRTFPGHDHNETCWAKRLNIPLEFLFVPSEPQ